MANDASPAAMKFTRATAMPTAAQMKSTTATAKNSICTVGSMVATASIEASSGVFGWSDDDLWRLDAVLLQRRDEQHDRVGGLDVDVFEVDDDLFQLRDSGLQRSDLALDCLLGVDLDTDDPAEDRQQQSGQHDEPEEHGSFREHLVLGDSEDAPVQGLGALDDVSHGCSSAA